MIALRMKKALVAVAMVFVGVLGLMNYGIQNVSAAEGDSCENGGSFLLFRAWYTGLQQEGRNGKCSIMNPGEFSPGGLSGFIWQIVLNVLATLSVVAGMVMVLMFMFGGFKYITARGDVGQMATAQKALIQTAIGLGICILAAAATNTIMALIYS